VHAVSSPDDFLQDFGKREGIPVHPVAMVRAITPLKDIRSLLQLIQLFRRLRPGIVHAHTPKAGVLGVLAARLAGVPVVVYTIHGLPFATAQGQKKWWLYLAEKISCRGAHHILGVSAATLQLALASGLCRQDKVEILGSGSVNGVDAEGLFNPSLFPATVREDIRGNLGIPSEALVIGYVGRIVKDKGIEDLAAAWARLRQRHADLYLVLIGQEEAQDPIALATRQALKQDSRVVFTGEVSNPAPYYSAMDMVVLPTYREGFPVVPLEAAAMGLPVVTTTVDGCPEAVVHGVTGILVPPRHSRLLAEALETLISDPEMRQRLGQAGRHRALHEFKPQRLWQELYNTYSKLSLEHP
jgi:glycosyltransferase involved in cell wall biosynthesis